MSGRALPDPKPPSNNMGVVTTEILVDWCSYTFRDRSLDEILADFDWVRDDLEDLERGGNGYQECLQRDGVRIYHGGREDMGVFVCLSGRACRLLENRPIFFAWQSWIERVIRSGGRITRIDLAIDERTGLLDLQEIERKVRAGEWSGKSRDYQVIASTSAVGGEGRTVYIGASSSPVRVRIYDKAAKERQEGHWVRVELQLRKDRAQEFAERFTEAVFVPEERALIQGVLRNYLEFKEPTQDAAKHRWPVSDWWERFVESADKVAITGAVVEDSIEGRRRWLMRQAAPSLALIWKADGGSYRFIKELVWEGLGRIPERLSKLLEGQVPLNAVEREQGK